MSPLTHKVTATIYVAALCHVFAGGVSLSAALPLNDPVRPLTHHKTASLSRLLKSGRQLRATNPVDGTAIINGGSGLAAGWSINHSGLGNVFGNGSTQTPNECITFPRAGAWLSFQCEGCQQPFALSNAGGVEYNISVASQASGQAIGTVPDFRVMQVILQDSIGRATCNLTMGKPNGQPCINPNPDGTCYSTSWFLNAPSNLPESSMDCRPALSSAVAVGFQSLQDGVTVCLSGLHRLPSTVITPDSGP